MIGWLIERFLGPALDRLPAYLAEIAGTEDEPR